MFLLLLPVVIGLLIFSMKYMFSRSTSSKVGQVILRAVLATMLIVALTGMSIKITGKDTTTFYLVDASDSVRENRDEVVKFVKESAKSRGKHDYIGVITFGSNSQVEQFADKELSFTGVQGNIVTEATNLEAAVNMAINQMPEGNAKRIVLITDGNENEGSLKNAAATVVSEGCVFEIKRVDENIADEVYVSDMKIPDEAGIGENFNIEVEVESNTATSAVVSLYSGRTLKGQQKVNLQKGTNNLVFKDTQTDEGLKTYRVVVEAEKDTLSVNNEFSAYTNIQVELPVLIIEGAQGNSTNLRMLFDSLGINYSIASTSTVPTSVSDFSEYSAMVMVDVYAPDLADGFADNLESYVRNYGGGLVITGGQNSYALGGYRGTPIETVSPVYMDLDAENEIPSTAFMMIIDKSGSMSDGNGVMTNLDLAKEAAVAALANLRPDDYVGVIAFDDTYEKVVPMQKPDDIGEIAQKIYGISIEGGTSIYPALLQGAEDISKTDAMIKHIILLTDGQDYMDDYEDLKKSINDAGITLSTVAVGSGCNMELLQGLADDCHGRCFYTDINSDLPRIFAQEVFLASNEYLVNEEFIPTVTSNDMNMAHLASDGLPTLLGYVATSKKERAIQVLESHYGDPILAYWQYGLGKSVAWTSDVTGQWSANYSNWENNQELWHNIIQYVTQDMGMEGAYVKVEQKGSKSVVKYSTAESDEKTKIKAIVMDDEGNEKEVMLDPKTPGEYEGVIPTEGTGVYTVNVQQYEGDECVGAVNTAVINQYSLEYRFYPNNSLLDEFANSVGAIFIEKAEEVFETKPEFVKGRFNLATPLLIIASLLFLLDIAARRFNIDLWGMLPFARMKAKSAAARAKQEEKKKEKMLKAATAKASAATEGASGESGNTENLKSDKPSKEETASKKKAKKAKEKEDDTIHVASEKYAKAAKEAKERAKNQPKPMNSTVAQLREKQVVKTAGNANAPMGAPRPQPPKPAPPRPAGTPPSGRPTSPAPKTKVWTRDNDNK